MPIRNPFARRTGLAVIADENVRPGVQNAHPGFERVDTIGSKASSILNLRGPRNPDTGEYKMSVVNDSGVYLPVGRAPPRLPPLDALLQGVDCPYKQPSPTDDRGSRRHVSSRASSDTPSSFGDIEHFSISRESFDSYRRSFDIMARSPISFQEAPARQSLDSARLSRLSRSAIDHNVEREPPTAEETFEDVGLDDQKQPPRRRGFFFSKLTDSQDKDKEREKDKDKEPATPSNVSRFLLPGRKRGQSGQGSELGNIEQIQAGSIE